MIELENFNHFKELITQPKPVVFYFGAPWCSSCEKYFPNFEQHEKNNPNMIHVKVNNDKFKKLAFKLSLRYIPTAFFFKDGQEYKRTVGSFSPEGIEMPKTPNPKCRNCLN